MLPFNFDLVINKNVQSMFKCFGDELKIIQVATYNFYLIFDRESIARGPKS